MCNFPALELLRMRRQLCTQADSSTDDTLIRQAAQFVLGTDTLRLAHVEITDCNCWAEAVAQVNREAA